MQKIDFTIKKSKGRSIRISINRQGQVFLHVPKFVPNFVARKFLLSKQNWVQKNLEKIKKVSATSPSRTDFLKNKEQARKLVLEKLEFWKNFYKQNFNIIFSWKRVSIKNTTTRWGSCSSKKNLNFSYKILELSEENQNYLIVHELCHLVHMNHSEKFWKLVERGIPTWEASRKQLKQRDLNY